MEHMKMHSGEKSNICNQCDFASFKADHLRRHLETHSGEKSIKRNQRYYASSQGGNLSGHMKMHSGEKSNKCNQCDYPPQQVPFPILHSKTRIFTAKVASRQNTVCKMVSIDAKSGGF